MSTNCAARFAEPITIIDDEDDDVQIFSPRSRTLLDVRGPLSHGRTWVPPITEEDLELRLGFKEYPKTMINLLDDGEDADAGLGLFDKKKFASGSSSRPMEMKVNLTCAICMDTMKEETSTLCGHIFCHSCITRAINLQKRCPTCRRKLSTSNVHRIYLPGTS
ncbi:uncharacterized protein LOC116257511 [Nymphaea colorata]|nr:uncharacterized protein LOC116257511 [Nymphaea colorata]